MDYFETCATSGDGVEVLFTNAASNALNTIKEEEDFMPASIGDAMGAIKIDAQSERTATENQKKKKKKCKC